MEAVTIMRIEPAETTGIVLYLSDETIVEMVPVEIRGLSPVAVVQGKVLAALRALLERAGGA